MTEDLHFGLLLMLYGMGLVFLILALLWGAIAIFQQIDRRLLAQEEEKARLAAAAAAPPTPDIPPDLLAAIMVALDHYRQEQERPASPLRRYLPQEIEHGQARWVAVGRSYQLHSNRVSRRRNKR